MTDEQLIAHYNEMIKMFGKLPNPEHSPLEFKYYVRLYQYLKTLGF